MKVLLVEDDVEVREVLQFLLESQFNAEVVETESGSQAVTILSATPDIDVVISDYNMPNGTGGDVFKFLLSKQSKIPFILCSSDSPEAHPEFLGQKLAGFAKKPFVNEPLIRILKELFHEKDPDAAPPEAIPGFCCIRLSSLMRMSALACDIYLKLGTEKYIKVANTGDFFEKDDFDRFSKKGLEYLYLPRESANFFLEKLTREILALRNAKTKLPTQPFPISEKALSIIHELSLDLGFTPEVQALAKANVSLALVTIESNPGLSDLLKTIFLNRDNYISSHSIALANVACGIAAQMQWQTGSTLFKLALAAFLHDITLKNQELAQIQNVEALAFRGIDGNKFSEEEISDFMKHPEAAAAVVMRFDDIPPDVDAIIIQHHELPNGTGFPHHLNHSRIFPLSSVFIVAHHIVSRAWVKGDAFDIREFLRENESKYNSGTFKKIAMSIALNHSKSD